MDKDYAIIDVTADGNERPIVVTWFPTPEEAIEAAREKPEYRAVETSGSAGWVSLTGESLYA